MMEDRIALLQRKLDFEDLFNILITRPSRYAGSEIDVIIRFTDCYAATTDPDSVEALGLVHGDTISICATIYPPGNILTPITTCTVFCSAEIADWVEERLMDGSLDEGNVGEEAYLDVRLKLLFGEMIRIEQIDIPKSSKIETRRPIDGLEIVWIYKDSFQPDSIRFFLNEYGCDDEEDDEDDF